MSLRTTQQIDKLIVGQIFPRDNNNFTISTGQILVTDATGRANWTPLSTLGANNSRFEIFSTQKGIITASANNSRLNILEGAGMNFQILSNNLYVNNTAFTAIDISGGNTLLSSNISNNTINPRLKFAGGNYTKLRGDPGTNTIFFDFNYLGIQQGARATYTSFILQNNSTYSVPPISESVKLDAIVSDASITLIGIDDIQLSNVNLSPTCNIFYIGLSTITAAKFSTVYYQATSGLSNLSTIIDFVNNRQINTQGLTAGQFYPISTLATSFSTSFSQIFLSNYFFPTSNQFVNLSSVISSSINDTSTVQKINATAITATSYMGEG